MKDKSPTLIKNIYYMLSYAFQVLRHSNYAEVAAEEFNNVPDLYAAILAAGIGQQLKQGLYRVYASAAKTSVWYAAESTFAAPSRTSFSANLRFSAITMC